jgi:hypothetical protein
MHKRLIFASLVVVAAAASAQSKVPTPQEWAAAMQPKLPAATSGGTQVVSVVADNNILIWTLKVPDEMATVPDDGIVNGFARGLCSGDTGKQFLAAGYVLRIEVFSEKHPSRHGGSITHCPS